MADEQQLNILKAKGVTAWNHWRGKNEQYRPDLTGTDLTGADLRGADLRGADLTGADLRGADLMDADLRGADLRGADLRGAKLRGGFGTSAFGEGAFGEGFVGDAAIFNFTKVSKETQGLEKLSDDQREGLIFIDEEPEDTPASDDDKGESANTLEDRDPFDPGYDRPGDGQKGGPDGMPDIAAMAKEEDARKTPSTDVYLRSDRDREEGSKTSDTTGALEVVKRQTRRLARAQQGVHVINGYVFILGAVKGLQLEDADEQSLIEEFQLALEALREELLQKNDQIAALSDTIAALEGETTPLKAELQDLRSKVEKAAHLGRRCFEKFCLASAGVLGATVTAGAIYGASEGFKYVIGQFGGEISDLLLGGPGAEEPPVPPPDTTVPV